MNKGSFAKIMVQGSKIQNPLIYFSTFEAEFKKDHFGIYRPGKIIVTLQEPKNP